MEFPGRFSNQEVNPENSPTHNTSIAFEFELPGAEKSEQGPKYKRSKNPKDPFVCPKNSWFSL